MKLALCSINWGDVLCFPWITRKKLGKIVDQFRNRAFAETLQYYLHERGNRMLSTLWLDKTLFDIPRTPMPENFKFFKWIIIWHFDSSTLAFLRDISPLFIDNDVNLRFTGHRTNNALINLGTVLDNLSPQLHGIHSMEFDHVAIPLVEQYFAPKLAQVKQLTIRFDFGQHDPATIQAGINFCLNWLVSEERGPTEPRLLWVRFCCADHARQFTMAVQQQFRSAKTPCTFAIGFIIYYGNVYHPNFHEENALGEQLDAKICGGICRHKVEDFTREQLEEWAEKKTAESDKSSRIDIEGSVTIGQIDANDGANDEGNELVDEEEADKPSTSG